MLLWQHPDRQIFSTAGLNLDGAEATAVVQGFITAFDAFLSEFAKYLLQLFHPFDLVTMHQKRDRESPVERMTVWTRRVRFDATFDSAWGGYALLDPAGSMEIWTGKDGGIEKGPASRLPTE